MCHIMYIKMAKKTNTLSFIMTPETCRWLCYRKKGSISRAENKEWWIIESM